MRTDLAQTLEVIRQMNRQRYNDADKIGETAEERHLPAPRAVRAGRPATRAMRIPSRNPTVRARVRQMLDALGYQPTPGDMFALTRWAHIYEVWRRIGERLDRLGPTKADDEPRKLLAEWRALSAELSRLEASLGITAAARASLGVDITRLRAWDAAAEIQRLRAVERDEAD